MNPKQFSRRMKQLGKGINTRTGQIVKRAATVAFEMMVRTTPVHTGRARSNWKVGIGIPFLTNNPPPVEFDGEAAAQLALGQGIPNILLWQVGGPDIIISNGVPYIKSLNDGSSVKAPAGMTRAAVLVARQAILNSKLLSRLPIGVNLGG